MSIGGSMSEVIINGRIFSVAADSDASRDLGGYSSEQQPNGNGTTRTILTAKPWKVGGLALDINDDRGDQEFLQDLQDSGLSFGLIFTGASGISYSGKGTISGDLAASSQSATSSLEFSGGGKLRAQ